MQAPAPGRSTGSLVIGFGMVSVPVSVYAGIEDDAAKIVRKWRTGDGHEVGNQTFDKETGEVVSRSDIYEVYITDDGSEVPLSNEEIAKVLNSENGHAEVKGFYPNEQIGVYVAENLMQIRPKSSKSKKNPFDKPFALLMGAMEETDTFALIEFTLRGKPSLGTLDAQGNLRVVRWENEVREARDMPEAEVSEAEHTMAVALVKTMQGKEAPQVACEGVEKVREYAETKAVSMGDGGSAPEIVSSNAESVTDLMAALAASIEAQKPAKKKTKKDKVKA